MQLFKFQWWIRSAGVVFVVLALLGFTACDQGPEQGPDIGAPLPPPVTVIMVQPESVEVVNDYAGRARAVREVQVRSRVGGILEERRYVEGQAVRQGAPLFQIERQPFEIATQRAEAELANAQAGLNQASRNWQRISGLFGQNAVSERERDRALSELEQAQARFALAEAGVAAARLDLEYTQVRASVSGVTGLSSLSEGSLVETGTLLTTITQMDPIHVRFALPEKDAALRSGGREQHHAAKLILPDQTFYVHPGEIDFTSSTIDPQTGTVSGRAVFANPDLVLIPGQFVRVLVTLEHLESVFLVPETAVSQGREAPQVFIVDDADTARARSVRLGPVVNGQQVILDGLQNDDRVVVSGHVALRDGIPVNVTEEAL